MPTYAQLDENNIAVSVSHLHSAVTAPNMIEVDPDSDTLGMRWTGLEWEHVAPTQPAPTRRLSRLAFMNRFTDEEFIGILDAAKASTAVEMWVKKLDAVTPEPDGTSVDLDDPRTIAGVNALELAGLIGEGRAAEVLA